MGLLGGAILFCDQAWAQEASVVRSMNTSASVDTLFTVSSQQRGGGPSETDAVIELRPTIRAENRSGRVTGSLAYSLNLQKHSKQFDGETVHNQLNASLSAEAIERHGYVDIAATITQQPASAYGQQSASGSSQDNPNRIEVGTLTISPYLRGVMGSSVSYELRVTANGTNGRRSIAADTTSLGTSLALSSMVPGQMIGWNLSASQQKLDYRAGRETTNERVSAGVSFFPDADLSLNATGGQESNDIANLDKRSYNNWGGGLTWRPTPRTRAQFQVDERYFGRSYQVLIEHRLASTSFQLTSSRDAGSSGSPSGGGGQPITIYQALDRLLLAQYPDPAERDQRIMAMLGGTDPGLLVGGGAIPTAVTVVQRHQFLASYGGPRLSGTFQVYSTSSRVVDAVAAANDSNQWGFLGTATYRLTPTAGISLSGSRLVTRAVDSRPGTELKSATLGWTDQIARRTTASVNLRYSVFNSQTSPYREGAVTANLSQRF